MNHDVMRLLLDRVAAAMKRRHGSSIETFYDTPHSFKVKQVRRSQFVFHWLECHCEAGAFMVMHWPPRKGWRIELADPALFERLGEVMAQCEEDALGAASDPFPWPALLEEP